MRTFSFLVVFSLATVANAGMFSKTKTAMDAEGNCLAEVINESTRLYTEIEALDKIAARSEAQAKSPVKESQKLGLVGFQELSAKVKLTRANIKKYGETYGEAACKVMLKGKVSMFAVKDRVTSLDQLAVGYEKMADDYTKPIAKK